MLNVTPIACLSDNYAYLLEDGSGQLAVVDASEAKPVLAALGGAKGTLTAIFSTHHHTDHVGGNEDLARGREGLRVYGHVSDRGRIPAQTDSLSHGQSFTWGATTLRALHIPGHTLGAVAYVADNFVFTGDTLFLAGCGRLFEGTASMMFQSLHDVLGGLGERTRVFCGHEYTVNNLLFAESVEPSNAAVKERLALARAQVARGEPTVGSALADEFATNPFLRVKSAEIRATLGLGSNVPEVEVFAALRRAKDVWRPGSAVPKGV